MTRSSNACALDESWRRLGLTRVSGRGNVTLDKRNAWSVPYVNCVIIVSAESRVNSGVAAYLCKIKYAKNCILEIRFMAAEPFPAGSAWLQFELK
jgi:hypothetical protein